MMNIIINVGGEQECALPHSLHALIPPVYLYVRNCDFLEQIFSALQVVQVTTNMLLT